MGKNGEKMEWKAADCIRKLTYISSLSRRSDDAVPNKIHRQCPGKPANGSAQTVAQEPNASREKVCVKRYSLIIGHVQYKIYA